MYNPIYLLLVLGIELVLFLGEIVLAARSKKNRLLHKANTLQSVHFIELNEGYRTGISVFRISLFIAFVMLIIAGMGQFTKSSTEALMLTVLGIALVYLLSLFHVKTFIFYADYFVVSSPFQFFRANTLIEYSSIKDFRIYRALYNSYYLSLELKTGNRMRIHFAGASLPRNDLVIRIVLNTKTGLNKDFRRYRKSKETW